MKQVVSSLRYIKSALRISLPRVIPDATSFPSELFHSLEGSEELWGLTVAKCIGQYPPKIHVLPRTAESELIWK